MANDQFVDEIETKSSFLWQANAKNRGLWVAAAETISKNMGSLGDSSTENRGSLEPYIRVTSL